MKKTWKVGELAKLAGLTERTLRYYDQIGLLSPSEQTDGGHRLYVEADMSRLQQIMSLKQIGLSLDEIMNILIGGQVNLGKIIFMQIEKIKQHVAIQQKLLYELEHLSDLMMKNETIGIEEFAKLFAIMRMDHENLLSHRRALLHEQFDRLEEYLALYPEKNGRIEQ